MLLLPTLCGILWILATFVLTLGTLLTLKSFLSPPPPPSSFFPISILKPVKGLNPSLIENLKSFLNLDYPEYEVILCLDSTKDPAYPFLKSFLNTYNPPNFRLLVQAENLGENPKVNNLIQALPQLKYGLVLISDSNVRATPFYLREISPHLNSQTGIVTSVVVGKGAQTFAGELESVFLNTFFVRWMWLCKYLNKPAVIGKSMFFSLKEAERFGGLKTLSVYIAEDYMAGQAFEKLGKKVNLCHKPVIQWIGHYHFKDFWKRHIRWGRIRKAQAPLAYFFEPLFFSTVSGVMEGIACYFFSKENLSLFIILHFSFWLLNDLALTFTEKTFNFHFLFAWPVREALSFPLYLHSTLSSKVSWRGRTIKIKSGGLIEKQRHVWT